MMENRATGGASWFLVQRVSGLLLVFLFLFHFGLMHFSGAELTGAAVSARLAGNLYRAIDLTFLVLALAHGLYGSWMVAADYFHRPWLRISVLVFLAFAGLGLAILGAITVLG